MVKYKKITESDICRLSKKGKGQGKGNQYKPWLTVRDVPSKGFSHRIKGWKTGRVQHLLSNLELYFFFMLEWSINVTDIREKYPLLPIESTKGISNDYRLNHPFDRAKNEFIVMTSDFLVDLKIHGKEKKCAYSVISSSQQNSKWFLERTLIEKTYWEKQNVGFQIITEVDIPMNLIRNVEWLHHAKDLTFSPGLSLSQVLEIENKLYSLLNSGQTISKGCTDSDVYFQLSTGTSFWVIKHLIANHVWDVDIYSKILANKPLLVKRKEPYFSYYKRGVG
ncbi:TnsA endonuclease C-terminal domain-containing protein [Bacillus sp. DJP31]|uniref:TnsA endonuclease C-terminal domain-containing protein n=1 Tax=Bacillus sp. DJP31 TaxID=3409789 RepID=UPI003BB7CA28